MKALKWNMMDKKGGGFFFFCKQCPHFTPPPNFYKGDPGDLPLHFWQHWQEERKAKATKKLPACILKNDIIKWSRQDTSIMHKRDLLLLQTARRSPACPIPQRAAFGRNRPITSRQQEDSLSQAAIDLDKEPLGETRQGEMGPFYAKEGV